MIKFVKYPNSDIQTKKYDVRLKLGLCFAYVEPISRRLGAK